MIYLSWVLFRNSIQKAECIWVMINVNLTLFICKYANDCILHQHHIWYIHIQL